ncbi:hypothetical protein NQ176_g2326 [Zarea fungicola]|uniref:Uncharacterized protein n=1 Tax=Zarea fungicola TaxID=93591 RepID=A0ACC1NPW4_9HYPO|nr:hypothetical protein NQ176_g2326 [Lecanicillium fungicola]
MSSNQDFNTSSTGTEESRRSSTSSASPSTLSTASPNVEHACKPEMIPTVFVSQAPVHPLPAYARDYPKPADDLDIDEALSRPPGRWTFRGSLQANLKKQTRPAPGFQEP